MRKGMLPLVLFTLCTSMFSATACSQNPFHRVGEWWQGMRYQFDLDSKRNHAYPQPFAVHDQMRVKQTFAPMFVKGASLNRILDSVHFDPKTNDLNNAGRSRLRQILEQQKTLDILVASTMNPEVDDQRKEKLRNLLAEYSFPGTRPAVATTFYLPQHKSGTEHEALRQRYFSSQLAPSIQSVSGSISGSASQ